MSDGLLETTAQLAPRRATVNRASELSRRDARVDCFRAWALLMMFIDHVPGTIYSSFTTARLGFSDAEAFVLISGLAAGLAYSEPFAGQPITTMLRILARARTIYLTHIAITVAGLGIYVAAALWFGAGRLLTINNIDLLLQHPLQAIIGLPLLAYQVGFFDILPMYFVLTLLTPLFLAIGLRWPHVLLLLSVALWAATGRYHLDLPTYPIDRGWQFDALGWQLIYVIGLLAGFGLKRGVPYVPFRPTLFCIAVGYLLFAFAWTHVSEVAAWGDDALHWLRRTFGLTYEEASLDKHRLAPLRILHALALAYVVASLPQVKAVCESRWAAPLRLLGRYGLAVFATQSLIAVAMQAVRVKYRGGPLFDAGLLVVGIGLMLLVALVIDRGRTLVVAERAAPGLRRLPSY